VKSRANFLHEESTRKLRQPNHLRTKMFFPQLWKELFHKWKKASPNGAKGVT
jgi:hypothetical protein